MMVWEWITLGLFLYLCILHTDLKKVVKLSEKYAKFIWEGKN